MRPDAVVEAQFRLEIRIIAVAEGEIAGRQQPDEDLDDVRIELSARGPAQLGDRFLDIDGLAVGVARGDHVVGVGDGDQPRAGRDLDAGQPARVAAAVPALVVGERHAGAEPQHPRRRAVEQAEVRRHPASGALLVANLPKARRALPSILHHHERWDGRGYPAGIAGSDIPAEARLVALADAYEAMTSHRPYRATLTLTEALDELTRCAGTQFDPILTHACVEVWSARLRLAV